MQKEVPIVDDIYTLQKFPGKGGWTYASLPHLTQNKKNPFGWLTVKGCIDTYEFKKYKLLPIKGNKLFLPVKASVRKIINKKAGDQVHVILYLDESPLEIPEEFLLCLKDEPQAYSNFSMLRESEQKAYLDWIYDVKTEKTKVERINNAIQQLIKQQKFHNK